MAGGGVLLTVSTCQKNSLAEDRSYSGTLGQVVPLLLFTILFWLQTRQELLSGAVPRALWFRVSIELLAFATFLVVVPLGERRVGSCDLTRLARHVPLPSVCCPSGQRRKSALACPTNSIAIVKPPESSLLRCPVPPAQKLYSSLLAPGRMVV